MKPGEIEVILVGNELLKGERRDAHLERIARVSARVGGVVTAAHVIGDSRESIAELIRDRADDARVMLVSGGLGPTHDDVTREGVADGLGLALEWHEDQWQIIQQRFASFGVDVDDSNRRQAWFPAGAQVLANPNGTAAGFIVEQTDLLVAVMPGPPRELNPMLDRLVLPKLDKLFARPEIVRQTFRTAGIGESSMTPVVTPLFEAYDDAFEVSSLPHLGGVDIVLTARPGGDAEALRRRVDDFERELRDALGDKVYAAGTDPLEAVVGRLLAERKQTVAVAESLTGGLIGKRLTDIAGSSAYVLADVVAYSNQAKEDFLGVRHQTLVDNGAVSEAVCREMAHGIRERTGATWGIATTGIAGPDGGSDEKPVGLTCYGVAWEGGDRIARRVFPGDRDDVRQRVAHWTLFLLYRHLR